MKTCLNICPSNYRQTPSIQDQPIRWEDYRKLSGDIWGSVVWQFWVIFTIRAFFESNLLKSELDVTQINLTRVTVTCGVMCGYTVLVEREICALPNGVNNKKWFPWVDNQPIITSFGRVMLSIELVIKHFKGRVKLKLITTREKMPNENCRKMSY